ncbi:hypothetical protein JCM10213_006376 [Rhodosporidiobolus nylandii]
MSCLATPLRFLALSHRELNLAVSVKSGQSFRWHRTAPPVCTLVDPPAAPPTVPDDAEEWALGWRDRTVVLRQAPEGLYYRSLYPYSAPPHAAFLADLKSDTTLSFIRRYFQLDVKLEPLYDQWAAGDAKFRKKVEAQGEALRGIRVLAQDEWETLVSFICSANNNIARITLMVNRLCAARGSALPHPSSFTPSCVHSSAASIPTSPPPPPSADAPSLFAFPPPTALTSSDTEPLLRQLGFGYRASFLPASAAHLLSVSSSLNLSPEAYLRTLRADASPRKALSEAREKLVEFKGVGRKVADCVLLFGLGWSECVPVDTHVFQIAIRDYSFPAPRSSSLTPALHDRVAAFLAAKWGGEGGQYAGWHQQVLFFADLKPSGSSSSSPTKKKGMQEVYSRIELEGQEEGEDEGAAKRKLTFEEEVAALIATPGAKRSRRSVVQASVKVEVKETVVVKREGDGYSSPLSSPEPESEPELQDPTPRKKWAAKDGKNKPAKGGRVKKEE